MNDIFELDAELEARKKDLESAPTVFDSDVKVSEDEIEAVKTDLDDNNNIIMIRDKDDQGSSTETALEDYVADLDTKIASISGDPESDKNMLRMVGGGDIKETVDDMKDRAKEEMMTAFKSLANNATEEEIVDVNEEAIKAIQRELGVQRLDSEEVANKLRKMSFRSICNMLPQGFLDIYTTKVERATQPDVAKDKLMAVISYLIVTGPESDYLNEYIDRENRLSLVSKELLQSQVDLADMIKDPDTLADIVKKAYRYSPRDESFWAKHIKIPNRVHNDFAQRAVMYEKYKEAYEKVLEKYKDDQEALPIIMEEINDCDEKIKVYTSVCKLEIIQPLWNTLMDRYQNNKKMSVDYIYKECISAVERIRKCKQNVPFPGYDGKTKKADTIFITYAKAFVYMITQYNTELDKVMRSDDYVPDESGIDLIKIDGCDDVDVATVYSMFMLILMGRVLKHFFGNNMSKYDAIMLDCYFRAFCKMGTDIYLMRDFWSIMKDGVHWFLVEYYQPAKIISEKKKKK